jgi:hypothetical protein
MLTFSGGLELGQNGVTVLSALATAGATWIAYINFRRTHEQAALITLEKLLEELRGDGMFEAAALVNGETVKSGGWAVLSDPQTRDKAGRTLASLCKLARAVSSYKAWHTLLDGSEWQILEEFMKNAQPLIVAVRVTSLELSGRARFYNGDKLNAAADIYRVLRLPELQR